MASNNALIENAFDGFTVNDEEIPVAYMHYDGHGEPYIVYSQTDYDGSYSADDELAGYVTYYDFDIYSKGNYYSIAKSIKETLKGIGFTWQPQRTSGDLYEADTGYYHKTLCFAKLMEE